MLTLSEFARKAIGVPFKPHGRDYSSFDCWAVVYLAYRDVFGIDLPTFTEASPADVDEVARLVGEHSGGGPWLRVDPAEHRQGDVALFRQEVRLPTHCGLVLGNWRMLHIRRGGLSEVASFGPHDWRGRQWHGRLVSIHRHAEVPA